MGLSQAILQHLNHIHSITAASFHKHQTVKCNFHHFPASSLPLLELKNFRLYFVPAPQFHHHQEAGRYRFSHQGYQDPARLKLSAAEGFLRKLAAPVSHY